MKSPSQVSLRAFRAFTAHVAPPVRVTRDVGSARFASLLKIVENDAVKKSESFRSQLVDAVSTIEAGNDHSADDMLSEVWASGMDSSAAVGEIIHAMAQTGHLRLARGLALSAFEQIEASDPFLRCITRVFETCLDYDAAHRAVESWLPLVDAGNPARPILERKLELYDGLRAEAFDFDVRWNDFRRMQECFVDAIRQEGKRVQSIALNGTLPCSVTLDFHIDADLDECIQMDFDLGGDLMHTHPDCHGMDVLPFCIVSFEAHRDSNPNTIKAIRRGDLQ